MRPVQRLPLSRSSVDILKKRTLRVMGNADPKAEAARSWKFKKNKTFTEIKACLANMAHSRARCMYCCDSCGTDIEHFWPKSRYPCLAFTWQNYLWACSVCNSNEKRDKFPLDANGRPLLLDPSADDPREHLALVPANGEFVHRSERGRRTIEIFRLNDHEAPRSLPTGRFHAFNRLQSLIVDYAHFRTINNNQEAERKRAAARDEPFFFLLFWLIETSQRAPQILDSRCVSALSDFPEILGWIP